MLIETISGCSEWWWLSRQSLDCDLFRACRKDSRQAVRTSICEICQRLIQNIGPLLRWKNKIHAENIYHLVSCFEHKVSITNYCGPVQIHSLILVITPLCWWNIKLGYHLHHTSPQRRQLGTRLEKPHFINREISISWSARSTFLDQSDPHVTNRSTFH